MPQSISSNATLHALTERLASHSRSLSPFSFGADRLAAYRQPAPPPQLPVLQLSSRHQDVPHPQALSNGSSTNGPAGDEVDRRKGEVRCSAGNRYPSLGEHSDRRCSRCEEEELDGFVRDMGTVMRREFDCWVEQCWTEAFHHMFTKTLPTLVIHLILTGSSPTFLRRQIVHGGPNLDLMFQTQILDIMYTELELRLSGRRPSEVGTKPPINLTPIPQPNAPPPGMPRDGVCFQDLSYQHGLGGSGGNEEDDHGMCLCQLTTCLGCFHTASKNRKGPCSLLPHHLVNSSVREGWTGGVESSAQAQARQSGFYAQSPMKQAIPTGSGFTKNTKRDNVSRPVPMFPHPQMTDVLAVEEHLRWRLKEMGAADPAVEARYGPSTNAPAALEGVDLPDNADEGSDEEGSVKGGQTNGPPKGKVVRLSRGKGKVRRIVNGGGGVPPKKKDEGKKDDKPKAVCYLPKEWAEADPSVRSTAIVLTFRHFVRLLHLVAVTTSPFSYPSYPKDIDDLQRVHPLALYRRLAEPSVNRRKNPRELRAWQECMDKWAEELGAREKTQGNKLVNEFNHAEAVEYYTRAISLDSKKTVYFSNRAVALNSLGQHEKAESDCKYILARDNKNGKAFYQRAVARKGMGRWREAEADLKEVLRYQPGNESAKKLMAVVKAEVAKLPKQTAKDVMDF